MGIPQLNMNHITQKNLLVIISISLQLLVNSQLTKAQDVKPFTINKSGLAIQFDFYKGSLRQRYMQPSENIEKVNLPEMIDKSDLETAIQITGRMRIGRSYDCGEPGFNFTYTGMTETKTALGEHIVISQTDTVSKLVAESHYIFYNNIPVIRRYTRLINNGNKAVGIEYVSSAMLNNMTAFGKKHADEKLVIHWANNFYNSEAQWRQSTPSQLGWFTQDDKMSGKITFSSLGTMSTSTYLPLEMVENTEANITWFWQIEHSGSWYSEMGSNSGSRGSYTYLGGPDEKNHHAWKQLQPGEDYTTVTVAVGCVTGGFGEAVNALTKYRRTALLMPHADNLNMPVIFNDYMNCLWADPTTEKELPLINAAAKAGADYFVIDAGWYAELKAKWWDEIGLWQPSASRFPKGIMEPINAIRKKGMKPGLWLEIELAGVKSPLITKPNDWFFMRHGKRVNEGGRYFLDFRNPEVKQHVNEVVNRVVKEYGIEYIKRDYNCSALFGTELNASSAGQGMMENTRSIYNWIDSVHIKYPNLVLENCSGGGMRMDYEALSRHQIQSSSDQGDYKKYPSIIVGELAAVLPEQLAAWTYPLAKSSAEEASFNMVSAMLCRIHLSGELDKLKPASMAQVVNGISVYKNKISKYLPNSTPFFPLGMPSFTDSVSAIAVGMKHAEKRFVSVWRLTGKNQVLLPIMNAAKAKIIYPTNLGVSIQKDAKGFILTFPKEYMAAVIEIAND